jgi:hypothetical protein
MADQSATNGNNPVVLPPDTDPAVREWLTRLIEHGERASSDDAAGDPAESKRGHGNKNPAAIKADRHGALRHATAASRNSKQPAPGRSQ